MELKIGEINKLEVLKETDISYTLTNGENTVFLHFNQTPNKLKVGDKVDAFLYFDQKKRLCATLEKPLIKIVLSCIPGRVAMETCSLSYVSSA